MGSQILIHSKPDMKLVIITITAIFAQEVIQNDSQIADNGLMNLWCDHAFSECLITQGTECSKNPELGAELLCMNTHCATRFSADKRHKKFCKRNRSISHCPPTGCTSLFDFTSILNYGCWCNFGSHLLKGDGGPVNIADQICRKLQLCLRCARYDGRTDPIPYTCEPINQAYTGAYISSNYEVDCSVNNQFDQCAEHVCSCNMDFIAELFKLIFDNDFIYESEYLHANGFSQADECYFENPGTGETACCGYYPTRYPYNTQAEFKSCCNDHYLFNPMEQQCCDDGPHQIGTC